jgi:DNA-binding transcriptional MocR family regulator
MDDHRIPFVDGIIIRLPGKNWVTVKSNRLIITTGALQAPYPCKGVFDQEIRLLVETPSFIGALSAFRATRQT